MRRALVLVICGTAACAQATPDTPDAPKGSAADAPKGAPDAPPGTPDAPIFDARPDAPIFDAHPADAGVVTGAPDTCAQAIDISTAVHGAAGADYSGDTTNYADDIAPTSACTGYYPDGPDAIYIVTLAANETLTATATPDNWDLSLELTSNCTHDATCVAGADSVAGPGAETLTYVATAAGTFYLVVDGYNPGVQGPFTMHVKAQ